MSRKIAAGGAVFETPRLFIRTVCAADVGMYHELWTNPQVMTNVGFPKGLHITKDEIAAKIAEQGETEFGRLLVVMLKSSSEAIGECKMYLPDEAGIATTDVKLLPRFWGNKYGVEVKRGLVDYLFTHTDSTAVKADPNIKNIASIKMQEAVGGVRVGEVVHEFPEHMRDYTHKVHAYVYHVYRADWEKKWP